jgi:Zn-finger nucleic acid-binding protein
MQALTCPKCQAEMRTYERNGIHVDQCAGCRGIFLDRGELERLIDAESAHYADQPATSAAPAASAPTGHSYPAQPVHHAPAPVIQQHHHYGGDRHYKYKKRKSFLKEILDFD